MKKERIIITGVPRSGTTAVKRFLGSNTGATLMPCIYPIEGIKNLEAKVNSEDVCVWKSTKWVTGNYLKKMIEIFGDTSHFVIVCRYPSHCYYSLLELNAYRNENSHPWVEFANLDSYLNWYKNVYLNAIEQLKIADCTYIAYEDFCHNPIKYKDKILTKVGVNSDGLNYYDNSNYYLEDEKCMVTNKIHRKSVFRFKRDSKSDYLYEWLLGKVKVEK